jgi:hypothetical protein
MSCSTRLLKFGSGWRGLVIPFAGLVVERMDAGE